MPQFFFFFGGGVGGGRRGRHLSDKEYKWFEHHNTVGNHNGQTTDQIPKTMSNHNGQVAEYRGMQQLSTYLRITWLLVCGSLFF